MSKWIIKNQENNFMKLCDDDESKDHYVNQGCGCHEISDSDHDGIRKGKRELTEKQPVNPTVIDHPTPNEVMEFTEAYAYSEIGKMVERMDRAINNNENSPAIWSTSKDIVHNTWLSLSEASWPISGNNLTDALENNSLPVPLSMEFGLQ